MKKTLYWILGLFLFCGWADLVWGQEIQKGGKKPTSFTYDEAASASVGFFFVTRDGCKIK